MSNNGYRFNCVGSGLPAPQKEQQMLRMMHCNLRYVAIPAEDIAGEWVSICLPLGVVSQGPSPDAAIANLAESIEMTVDDDFENDWNPLDRKPAAREYHELFERVAQSGTPVTHVPSDRKASAIVGYIRVDRPEHPAMGVSSSERDSSTKIEALSGFQMWDLERLRNSDPVSHC